MTWLGAAACLALAVYSFRLGLDAARAGEPVMFLIMCWYTPALCVIAAVGLVTS